MSSTLKSSTDRERQQAPALALASSSQLGSPVQKFEKATKVARLNTARSFLDLPTEIREKIYNSVLSDGNKRLPVEQANPQLQQPPLTRCCRLIRTETLGIFYGNNEFHTTIYKRYVHGGAQFRMHGFNAVWMGDELMLWLSMIGEENVDKLRVIVFWGGNLGVKAHFTNQDKFRLCCLEEAQNGFMERNIVADHRESLEKEIMSFDASHISRIDFICWIRDKLVGLPSPKPKRKASILDDAMKPSKFRPEIPESSKIRLDLLLFR